jgi:hypothetical protein
VIEFPVLQHVAASVSRIRELILAAQPDADPNLVGGLFDAYGSAEWTPSRPEGADFSAWGPVEVWEHQEPVPGGLKPSGYWAVWDADSNMHLVINPGPHLTSREQAELAAVTTNRGKRTRIVEASGAWSASMVDYNEACAVQELAERHHEAAGG